MNIIFFGGHELDASGRLIRFGSIETEQVSANDGERKSALRHLGWWHVVKYWRHLTGNPNVNMKDGADETALYQLLLVDAYGRATRENKQSVYRADYPIHSYGMGFLDDYGS